MRSNYIIAGLLVIGLVGGVAYFALDRAPTAEETAETDVLRSRRIRNVLDDGGSKVRSPMRQARDFKRSSGKPQKITIGQEAERLFDQIEDANWEKSRAKIIEELLVLVQKGGLLTPPSDQEKFSRAEALRMITDVGRNRVTRAVARTLRTSRNRDERQAALDAFSWVGSEALAELTSMLADPDAEIAKEAFEDWTQALHEVDDDSIRCEAIKEAVKTIDDVDEINSIMLELAQVEFYLAVETLDAVILDGETGEVAKQVAKSTYSHLCDSEYESHEGAMKQAEQYRHEREDWALSEADQEVFRQKIQHMLEDAVTPTKKGAPIKQF